MNILATLCYLQKDGKTLMICPQHKKDEQYNNKWNGLGGKIDSGETPEECATREVREESGLTLTSMKYAGFLTFPKIIRDEDWYTFVFVSNDFSGKIKESSEGKLKWIKNEEILKRNLWEGDHIFLPYLFANKFFSGKFIYKEGKLLDHSLTIY